MSNSAQVIVTTCNNSKADAVTSALCLQNWFRNLVSRRNAVRLAALLTLLKWEQRKRAELQLYLRSYSLASAPVSETTIDMCEIAKHTESLSTNQNNTEEKSNNNASVYELWEVMYKVLRAVIEYERRLHAENYTRVLLSEELLQSQMHTIDKKENNEIVYELKHEDKVFVNNKMQELRNVIAKLPQIRKLYMLPDETIGSLLSLLQVESVMHPLTDREERNNESENVQDQVQEQILLLLEECIGVENTEWLLQEYITCVTERECVNAESETQDYVHCSLHGVLQTLSLYKYNNSLVDSKSSESNSDSHINDNNEDDDDDKEEQKNGKQEIKCNTTQRDNERVIKNEISNASVNVDYNTQLVNSECEDSSENEENGQKESWPAPLSRFSEMLHRGKENNTSGLEKQASDNKLEKQGCKNELDKQLNEELLLQEWENVDEECDEEVLNKRFMEHVHTREEKLRKDIADRLNIETEEVKETRRLQSEKDDNFTIDSEINFIRQFGLGFSVKANTNSELSGMNKINDEKDKAYCAVCELSGVRANANNYLNPAFSNLEEEEESVLLVTCATCNVYVHKMCAINDVTLNGCQHFCCTQCCKLYNNDNNN